MGINIQKKAQKSFKQHTDKALADVTNGDLFDRPTESCPRQFIAKPIQGNSLNKGDTVNLELKGKNVIGTLGATKVLQLENPPLGIIDFVKSKSGIAEANIAKLNPLSGTIEVNLC